MGRPAGARRPREALGRPDRDLARRPRPVHLGPAPSDPAGPRRVAGRPHRHAGPARRSPSPGPAAGSRTRLGPEPAQRTQAHRGGDMTVDTAELIAGIFHATYETLAPAHGYTTREASAVDWPDVPEPNRSLMIAVVQNMLNSGIISPGPMTRHMLHQADELDG